MQRNYYQKTIYVKQEDLAVFEEAAKLGESLSSVIAESLREYAWKRSRQSGTSCEQCWPGCWQKRQE